MLYDMVFEGGGAKGMVFLGALQVLQTKGYTAARLLGTSAGSIMSTLLAAGYEIQEMENALKETRNGKPVFMGFLESPKPLSREEIANSDIRKLLREVNVKLIPDGLEDRIDDSIATALSTSTYTSRIFSFFERGGFYAADFFLDWLTDKLNSGNYPLERGNYGKGTPRKFGEMNMTQFFDATGVDLSLIASDTSQSEMLVLNHRTAPNCPVRYAVRMSMSLPLLWEEVVWKKEWGDYRGRDITGDTIVDGGMLSNFPIELFLSKQPQVTAVMGDIMTEGTNVLGFLIDEKLEVPGADAPQPVEKSISLGELKPIVRIEKFINTVTQAHDKSVIDAFERYVVHLPAKSYGTIEFGMSDQRRTALINAGRQATQNYFTQLEAMQQGGISFGIEDVEGEATAAADKIAAQRLFK